MNINTPIIARPLQWIVIVFCFIAHITPVKIWTFFGRCVGRICYHIFSRHRKIALTNIKFAMGDTLSEEEQQKIIRRTFQVLGMCIFDAFRCPGFTISGLERFSKNISYEGLEHLEEAQKQGTPILLLNAHFGMVEFANLFYTQKTGRKLNFILRKFDNQHLQKVMTAHNKKFGINLLYKQSGLRPAMKNLLKGQDLVIFPDQRSNLHEGVVSSIFGKKSTTLSLLPALATKLNAPILPMFLFRQADNVSHKLVFYPPIIAKETDTIETLTQKQNDAIERAIRQQPDHWLWLHRRWKEDFPEMYKGL